ncbi:hypothetical protein SNEBB_002264 [Seison nebaliae]|nr:hypothetical protein SNEBB_002264 [Seison nebaliae]
MNSLSMAQNTLEKKIKDHLFDFVQFLNSKNLEEIEEKNETMENYLLSLLENEEKNEKIPLLNLLKEEIDRKLTEVIERQSNVLHLSINAMITEEGMKNTIKSLKSLAIYKDLVKEITLSLEENIEQIEWNSENKEQKTNQEIDQYHCNQTSIAWTTSTQDVDSHNECPMNNPIPCLIDSFGKIGERLDVSLPKNVRLNALNSLLHALPADLIISDNWKSIENLLLECLLDKDLDIQQKSLQLHSRLLVQSPHQLTMLVYNNLCRHIVGMFVKKKSLQISLKTIDKEIMLEEDHYQLLQRFNIVKNFLCEVTSYWLRAPECFGESVIDSTFEMFEIVEDKCENPQLFFLYLSLIDINGIWITKLMYSHFGRQLICRITEKFPAILKFPIHFLKSIKSIKLDFRQPTTTYQLFDVVYCGIFHSVNFLTKFLLFGNTRNLLNKLYSDDICHSIIQLLLHFLFRSNSHHFINVKYSISFLINNRLEELGEMQPELFDEQSTFNVIFQPITHVLERKEFELSKLLQISNIINCLLKTNKGLFILANQSSVVIKLIDFLDYLIDHSSDIQQQQPFHPSQIDILLNSYFKILYHILKYKKFSSFETILQKIVRNHFDCENGSMMRRINEELDENETIGNYSKETSLLHKLNEEYKFNNYSTIVIYYEMLKETDQHIVRLLEELFDNFKKKENFINHLSLIAECPKGIRFLQQNNLTRICLEYLCKKLNSPQLEYENCLARYRIYYQISSLISGKDGINLLDEFQPLNLVMDKLIDDHLSEKDDVELDDHFMRIIISNELNLTTSKSYIQLLQIFSSFTSIINIYLNSSTSQSSYETIHRFFHNYLVNSDNYSNCELLITLNLLSYIINDLDIQILFRITYRFIELLRNQLTVHKQFNAVPFDELSILRQYIIAKCESSGGCKERKLPLKFIENEEEINGMNYISIDNITTSIIDEHYRESCWEERWKLINLIGKESIKLKEFSKHQYKFDNPIFKESVKVVENYYNELHDESKFNIDQFSLIYGNSQQLINCQDLNEFDWFVSLLFIILEGDESQIWKCLNLMNRESYRSLWYKNCHSNSDTFYQSTISHHIILLLQIELPQIYSVFLLSGLSPIHTINCWLKQSFWNYFNLKTIIQLLHLSLERSVTYQIYICLAIFKHLEHQIIQHHTQKTLHNFLIESPIRLFEIENYREFIDTLHHKHTDDILSDT